MQSSASSSQLASKSRMYKSTSHNHASPRPFPSLATVTRAAAAAASSVMVAGSATQPQPLLPPHPPVQHQQQQQQQKQLAPSYIHNHQNSSSSSAGENAPYIPFVESIAGMSDNERDRGDDHFHWVYATTREILVDVQTGEEVAGPSERVLLVYPMHNHTETGTVQMRLKQIDPVTAQLSLRWVTVYNSSTNERLVGDFSLIP